MPEVLGTAVLELKTDASGMTRGMTQAKTTAKSGMAEMEQSAKKLGRTLKAALSVTAILLAARALKRIASELSDVFAVQEQAEARLRAIVRATGEAAGFTASQMFDMASSLQSVTTSGDEAIIGMQAIIATFRSIQGDVFQRTTELALDLSAAMGTDLKSSALQLGKALQDPAIGLTALSRSGITFTQVQKDMVLAMTEAGDVVGAQTLILDELEAQVGGVARAMAQTSTGAILQFENAWGDLKEQIGEVITRLQGVGARKWRETVERLTAWLDDHTDAIVSFFLHLPEAAQLSMTLVAEIIKKVFTSDFLFNAAGAVWKAYKESAVAGLKFHRTLVESVGTLIWEPLAFGFRLVVRGIKMVWREVVDFIVDLINNSIIVAINAMITGLEAVINTAVAAAAEVRHIFSAERRAAFIAERSVAFAGIAPIAAVQRDELDRAVGINTDAIDAAFENLLTGAADLVRETFQISKNLVGELAEPFGDLFDEFLQDMGVLVNQDLPASLQEGLGLGGTGGIGGGRPLAPAFQEFNASLSLGTLQFGTWFLAQNALHNQIVFTGEALKSLGEQTELSTDQLRELDLFRRNLFFEQGGPGGGIMPEQGRTAFDPMTLAQQLDPAMAAVAGAAAFLAENVTSVALIMDPLNLALQGMFDVIGPAVDEALAPLIGLIIELGRGIGTLLLPVIQALGKFITWLVEKFLGFYNNFIRPFAQILGVIVGLLYNFGVLIWNIISLNWSNLSQGMVDVQTVGLLPEITIGGALKAGTQAIKTAGGADLTGDATGDATGRRATFRQQRPIIVTVNVFDNQVFGGNIREFGIIIRDELLEIGELGL